MWYALAAEAVLIAHLLFIVTVGFGGAVTLVRPWFALLHVPAFCWGVYVSFTGRICPLTPLEQWLRSAAGQQGYAGGFIDHYLMAVIYPVGLTRSAQVAIGLVVIAVNAVFYGFLLYRGVRYRKTRVK